MGQGAAIGLGSLFMQCNEACNKQSKTVRETILKVLKNEGHQGRNRGDTILRRQGALLGAGLMDAGGRNLLLQLRSPLHCMRREATLCCVLATQLWEWFPLFNLIAKSLAPSALLAVDTSLRMPSSFSLMCSTDPALFDYVPPLPADDDASKSQKSNVQFSFQQTKSSKITLSSSLRRLSTHGGHGSNSLHARKSELTSSSSKAGNDNNTSVETKKEEEEKEKTTNDVTTTTAITETKMETTTPAVPRPTEFEVKNASRVTPLQIPFLELTAHRFSPVLDMAWMKEQCSLPEVMVVRDHSRGMPCAYVGEESTVSTTCPEPFIYHIPEAPAEVKK